MPGTAFELPNFPAFSSGTSRYASKPNAYRRLLLRARAGQYLLNVVRRSVDTLSGEITSGMCGNCTPLMSLFA
jgi:hypothetical protein